MKSFCFVFSRPGLQNLSKEDKSDFQVMKVMDQTVTRTNDGWVAFESWFGDEKPNGILVL
jgi:hypothetical protein